MSFQWMYIISTLGIFIMKAMCWILFASYAALVMHVQHVSKSWDYIHSMAV